MLIVDAFVWILCSLNIFKEKCATHVKHGKKMLILILYYWIVILLNYITEMIAVTFSIKKQAVYILLLYQSDNIGIPV